jgi:hypothetical protein
VGSKSENKGPKACANLLINWIAPAAGWFVLIGSDDFYNRFIVPDSAVGA